MRTLKASLTLLFALFVSYSLQAATITWAPAYNFNSTDHTLLLNDWDSASNGGLSRRAGFTRIDAAVSFGLTSTPVVNGISFETTAGSTDFWGHVGIDPDIDNLLSGHTANGPLFELTFNNLHIGQHYQVQLIGTHDIRGGINQRQYEVSFGGSDFTSGGAAPILTRHAYGNTDPGTPISVGGVTSFGTIVGSFVADSTVQVIQLRSNQQDGNLGDDPDAGLSGYVLITVGVPEPGTVGLLAMGLGVIGAVRRKKRSN